MITETVTLELPEPLVRTARRIAEATDQPLDAVLQASIAHALPPLDDVPAEEAAELARLALLDDGALWRVARGEMDAQAQTDLENLLDRQAAGALGPAEQDRLQGLMELYGQVMVQKAHANLLLARRGYRVLQQGDPE